MALPELIASELPRLPEFCQYESKPARAIANIRVDRTEAGSARGVRLYSYLPRQIEIVYYNITHAQREQLWIFFNSTAPQPFVIQYALDEGPGVLAQDLIVFFSTEPQEQIVNYDARTWEMTFQVEEWRGRQ